jgi:hypothetical protein
VKFRKKNERFESVRDERFESVVYDEEIKRVVKGVMKDWYLKVRDLHVSDTLGWTGNWNTWSVMGECVI